MGNFIGDFIEWVFNVWLLFMAVGTMILGTWAMIVVLELMFNILTYN